MAVKLILPTPPSVNNYYRKARKFGKVRVYISPQGRKFKAATAAEAVKKKAFNLNLRGRLKVVIKLSAKDKRRYDIDNRIKATLDALQDARVFENDEQVDDLRVIRLRAGEDFCEVSISEIESNG